ncbi:MAG: isochorismate synthase [Streptosporangiales bacterium]|nr:isochorismate synthase [Streptosporangiales bacterium]
MAKPYGNQRDTHARAAGDYGGPLTVRSTPVPDPGSILDRVPVPGETFSWVRHGAGLAGWGEAARVTIPAGEDRFTAGEKWLREIADSADVADEAGCRGSGLVAFGSFTFDSTCDGSVLVVPRVLIGRDGRGGAWVTTVTRPGEDEAARAGEPVQELDEPSGISWHDGSLSAMQHEQAVAAAVRRISGGELRKVVLARDLFASADRPLDQRVLLRRLADRYPDCYTFACAGLLGATPELLISRDGCEVSSLVLAGTMPRGAGAEEDARIARELLGSAKDNEEHAYAVSSLREVLEPLCEELVIAPHPQVLRLPNLQHLGTPVRGRLRAGGGERGSLALAAALHPTAAVGGTPTPAAVEVIRELESMDRDRYAGPVGWTDAEGNGEWGIALRCAQVEGAQARLFAGGGIVKDSDPATELAETQIKFRPMRTALEQAD